MFSNNGAGIRFFTTVDYTYVNDWMLFALWYSMQKYLPDAELIINCKFAKKIKNQFFLWCNRCNVNFGFNKVNDGIVISPNIIMIRELPENIDLYDIKSVCSKCQNNLFTPFVSYEDGFGNFVMADWINTIECPFPVTNKFITPLLGVNEIKIIKLWKQLNLVYATVSRA